jgi:hypothetical protein
MYYGLSTRRGNNRLKRTIDKLERRSFLSLPCFPPDTMAPRLLKLPAELLFHIYSLLDDLRDVNSLARTNTYLRCLFLSRRDEIVDWIMVDPLYIEH